MTVFHSAQDLHVVVRTEHEVIVDARAACLQAQDQLGDFQIKAFDPPVLAALVPGEIVLRRRDGGEIKVRVNYGSLTAVGNQVRVTVNRASLVDAMPLAV